MLNANSLELTEVPLVFRKAILMSQGIWNNVYYDSDEIQRAYNSTNWKSREKRNLFLDHKDFEASEWIGEVDNMFFKNDTLYGDLVVYDPIWATKLKYGKPKVGISPKVVGEVSERDKSMRNFTFENFSLVINPAVKTAYINNMEVLEMSEDNIDEVLEADIETELKKKPKPEDEEIKKKPYPYPEKAADKDEEKKKKYPAPDEAAMREQEILEAAREILKKKKYPYPPEAGAAGAKCSDADDEEALSDLELLAEMAELKKMSVADIARKAKKIRKEGESWTAAIKRAAKMQDSEPVDELKEKVSEMSKRIEVLNAKLNEPAKTEFKKAAELSEGDVDLGMIKYLQQLEVESNA